MIDKQSSEPETGVSEGVADSLLSRENLLRVKEQHEEGERARANPSRGFIPRSPTGRGP